MKKTLGFSGSNSSRSVNQQLVKHAAGLLKDHEITVINLANMKSVLPHWGASAVFADFSVGSFYQAYNSESQSFTDAADQSRLQEAVQDFEKHLTNESINA